MPRTLLNKKEYMLTDFVKWLKGEMFDRKLHNKDMGELLGITPQAFSKRMKKRQFSVEEAMVFFHKFNTPSEKISQLLKY